MGGGMAAEHPRKQGKRFSASGTAVLISDHPRVRGEDAVCERGLQLCFAVDPRVRGENVTRCNTQKPHRGTPPQAGKTEERNLERLVNAEHPR